MALSLPLRVRLKSRFARGSDSGRARRAGAVAAGLESRENALNGIRLLLAVLVIVDHSSMIGSGRPSHFPYLGGFAVDAFFAISGYLIAGSRLRMAARPYAWRRFLRLMPAYWAVLLVTAFMIAPLSARLAQVGYDCLEAVKYVLYNSALFTLKSGIGSTPWDVPYAGLWNGAVWSLPYEALAYVFFGFLIVMPRFGVRASACVCGALGVAVLLQRGVGIGSAYAPELWRLWSFFGAGVLLWFLRDRLPESPHVVAAASLLVGGALAASHTAYLVVAPIPLAFALLWFGARLPVRLGVRNDISYGMYVFAFPVQQLLAVARVPEAVGYLGFMVISVALTVPVAWASWLLVERPSMRLRALVPASNGLEDVRPSGRASAPVAR